MENKLYLSAKAIMEELIDKANLNKGNIVIIGCSTSEIIGEKIGTNSSFETAQTVFKGFYEIANKYVYITLFGPNNWKIEKEFYESIDKEYFEFPSHRYFFNILNTHIINQYIQEFKIIVCCVFT